MTTAQVVEMSVAVNNNSPIQDCVHPDDQTQPTFEILYYPYYQLLACEQALQGSLAARRKKEGLRACNYVSGI